MWLIKSSTSQFHYHVHHYFNLKKCLHCPFLFFIFFQGLPIIDDGNGQNFFCALRLVVESQAADPQKLFPQSARTKCVKPSISRNNDVDEGIAKWNELFIFEIPRKVSENLISSSLFL